MSEELRRTRERLRTARDRLWDKVTAKIPRLSRPWRVVRNLLCIVLAVYLIWMLGGENALTPERAFRRAEQQAMVGPSEIMLERRDGDMVTIMGRTDHGYFFVMPPMTLPNMMPTRGTITTSLNWMRWMNHTKIQVPRIAATKANSALPQRVEPGMNSRASRMPN